jgi:hypothetical protein
MKRATTNVCVACVFLLAATINVHDQKWRIAGIASGLFMALGFLGASAGAVGTQLLWRIYESLCGGRLFRVPYQTPLLSGPWEIDGQLLIRVSLVIGLIPLLLIPLLAYFLDRKTTDESRTFYLEAVRAFIDNFAKREQTEASGGVQRP